MLRLVIAAALLVVVLLLDQLFGETLADFVSDILRGSDAFPQWMIDAVVYGTRILAGVLVGALLAWAVVRRRWRMLATVGLAGVSAAAAVKIFDAGTETVAIAAVAGVLTAAAPWLGRRARRAGWVLMVGLIVCAFVLPPTVFDVFVGGSAGWLIGAAVLVLAGAPSRRPTMQAVLDGLAAVGVDVRHLERASVDARGSTPYFGVETDGSRIFVKALGTDERSADLLFRLYRWLLHRNFGDQRPFASLQRAVEHEALVALAAGAIGVRTPSLRAIAAADPNGAVLAYEAIEGKSLDRVDPNAVTDDVLAAIWSLVGELHRHRLAHRDLRLANIFLDDRGQVWLIDFGFGEVVASDLLVASDVAELLASSSLRVGTERAVDHAARAVDQPTLSLALDRLRPWALSRATRTAVKARAGLLDDLRERLARAAGVAGT